MSCEIFRFADQLPKNRSWFGTVTKMQNARVAAGIDHLSFDKTDNRQVLLANKQDQTWSGSYATYSGVLNGYDLPTEEWTIISRPTGAMIYTEAGAQGSTTTTISLAKTQRLRCTEEGWLSAMYSEGLRTADLERESYINLPTQEAALVG
jgi:hypothetical protein